MRRTNLIKANVFLANIIQGLFEILEMRKSKLKQTLMWINKLRQNEQGPVFYSSMALLNVPQTFWESSSVNEQTFRKMNYGLIVYYV